ncbi:MAG: hypothetical protein EXS37_17515 [Opitutus sp.]|nr:hypothetical protein [Opitutus sp.]
MKFSRRHSILPTPHPKKTMNRKNPIATLAAYLGLALLPAHAAQTANAEMTGVVSGRVQNAATGKYLSKARVSVKGTDLVTYSDTLGAYSLDRVPGGPAVLEVFYTDLDPQAIPLDILAGQSIRRDVDLTSVARYGHATGVVKLDSYVVASNKETDGEAIAINEKRFSGNIKEVISTDALGDILGGNAGEFMKYIPGLTVEQGADVTGVSVRGIGSDMTTISTDGAELATANNLANRGVDLRSMTINNISRIEVTKVPTPATPADSLAGSINMVSKSAFDRSIAQFRFGLSLLGNSEDLTFGKRPYNNLDRKVRVLRPGMDFEFSVPMGKNFGIVATGMSTVRFTEQHMSQMNYNTGGTSTGASLSRPYLQSHLLYDGPRLEERTILSFKADWRVTPNSVLSVATQWNLYDIIIGINQWTTNVGTIGTPTPVGGVAMSFGEDFVRGATGRGTVNVVNTGNHATERTKSPKLSYRFDDGRWRLETGFNRTASRRFRADTAHGSWGNLTATLIAPVRVTFSDIHSDYPGAIQVFDVNNREVDARDLGNYRLTTANLGSPFTRDSVVTAGNLHLRRRFDFFSFPTALQIGGSHRRQTLDSQVQNGVYNYVGTESAAPYRSRYYGSEDAGYGFGANIPWISATKGWEAFEANPNRFTQTLAQRVAQETSRLTASEGLVETVSAYYLQAEATLLNNRLKVLTGVRYEKTTDEGLGLLSDPNAVFVRRADGSFARDAAGNRIRKPGIGAAGSLEELQVTLKERGYQATRTYDGTYPSLHLSYNVRENLVARAAYARTYGRPNFDDIIPRTIVNERDLDDAQLADPTVVRGTLTVRNTGLRPWTADNFDLSLEYYTDNGGIFSAGVFLKQIADFFGAAVKVATLADLEQVGLDAQYVGWNLSTQFNSGDARITGVEFNLRQSLRELGSWGRFFTVFANGTKLKLQGDGQASFTSFIPESANWGVSFNRKRVTVMTKWNYRGLDKRGALPAFGPDGYEYFKARTKLDLNLAYQFTPRLSLIFSSLNILNEPHTTFRYGSQTPAYARSFGPQAFGVTFSVGVKGTY